MKRVMRRWALSAAVASLGLAAYGLFPPRSASAAQDDHPQVASVDQLKTEAFHDLRDGHFDQTDKLLAQAAEISHDPLVERMAGWAARFETQREEFAAERHKQYDKAVEDVKLLLDHDKPDYASDAAARAYLLSDDKKVFRGEGWVDSLVKSTIERADQDDKSEQWIKALRLYSDLAAVEPSQALWKDRLKLVTRRVRLLALYTPDVLRNLQKGDVKERDEVDRLLHPTTEPTTKPEAKPRTKPSTEPEVESFKVDWREALKGVKMDALRHALIDARENYYRDVSYRDMGLGGLTGLEAVVTTKGLDQAFPKLGDPAKRAAFMAVLDEQITANKDAKEDNQRLVLAGTLDKIEASNRDTIDLPEEVLVSEFADGAFARLDPFSSIIWPTDVEEFRKTTSGEFSGVGIQIESGEDGSLKVVSPLEESPAERAGIKAGDIITHINGKSAKGISINQAVKTITGERGTTVTLTIKSPDGKSKDYKIERELIHVASVKGYEHKVGGGWNWFVDPDQKIAYLRITNFTGKTGEELEQAVNAAQHEGARAMIIDLRYNPGGLLTAAIETCDKFLSSGVIVSTHPDRVTGNPPTVNRAKKDDDDCTLPLVVLVNQYSASASEIVSGALKDQHRALLVGERTFGKGSVQMLFPLPERPTLLKLTTSHYYLPNGKCIHREENSTEWGVDPDVTIEMTPEQMRAAIDARQDMDVLRDAESTPAEGEQPKLDDKSKAVEKAAHKKKDVLSADPQLSAAVLMLRLEINGAQL